MRNKFIMFCMVLCCGLANAATIEQPLANAAQEKTAQAIIHELKCVVCEGQSLADSDAALAKQMRAHVRKLVAEGTSRADILAFFRTRYGEQILMTPPLEPTTALLWLAPLLLLLLGGMLVWRTTRHT
jgi:cytochrome c-type biogenesis protein CcmH